MKQILLATNNPTKRQGMKRLLAGLDFDCLTVDDVDGEPQFEEDGETFEENAIIKAVNWSKQADCLTIASDGGVVIPVLGDNWNALLTRRFAGEDITDEDRVKALLDIMKPHSGDKRHICWKEAIAIAQNGKQLASWQIDGDKGLLAETYNPKNVQEGWWVTALWFYPQFNKMYFDLSEKERTQVDVGWQRMREKVHEFFGE